MENKIEFNWEKYQSGEYDCITRDGRKVKQLHLVECDADYPLRASIDGVLRLFRNNGKFLDNIREAYDLFLIPKVIPELKGVLMEVSDYKDFKVSCEEMVLGTYKGIFISDVGEWKYARPIKEVKEAWVNVYEANEMIEVGASFKTKDEAEKMIQKERKYIKTIKITNEKE